MGPSSFTARCSTQAALALACLARDSLLGNAGRRTHDWFAAGGLRTQQAAHSTTVEDRFLPGLCAQYHPIYLWAELYVLQGAGISRTAGCCHQDESAWLGLRMAVCGAGDFAGHLAGDGLWFCSGRHCLCGLHGIHRRSAWLACVVSPLVAAVVFFMMAGPGYLRMLKMFAHGIYNFVVEPLPHVLLFLLAFVWLVPLALARSMLDADTSTPLLIALYFFPLRSYPLSSGGRMLDTFCSMGS